MSVRAVLARPVPGAIAAAVVALPAIVLATTTATASADPQPVDFGLFGPAGAALLTGHWSTVFGDPLIQAGPFELLPWGLLQLLGVTGPLAWTVALTVCATLTAFLTAVVLRPTLAPDLRSSVLAAAGTALLALTGPVAASWALGHPAEVLVPLIWVVAGRLALRNRPVPAALLVAASSGFEVWGVLGAPVVLLAADPRLMRAAGAGALGLAVLWLPFVAAGPFRMFAYTWGVSDESLIHLLQPAAAAAPWSWRLVQAALAVGVGCVVALLLRRRDVAWGPWAVVTVTVATRLVLDPVLAGYYWEPALVGAAGALVLAAHRRDLAAAAVGALSFGLAGAGGAPVIRAALMVVVLLAAAVVLRLVRRRPATRLRERALTSASAG